MKNWFKKIAFLGIAMLLLSGSCEKNEISINNEKEIIEPLQPKSLIGNSDYDKSWRIVDSLDRQGLQKSALEVVTVIMEKAVKELNQPQQIKALFYQLKYQQNLEEDAFVKALQQIDDLRKTNQIPLKQILSSVKAELLWGYFQNNRYRFYNRSTTSSFDLGDVTTWDLKTLLSESGKLYMTSLEDKGKLQQINVKDYEYILEGATVEGYETTPTVFDFLAYRALEFFENDETSITRPADKFTVNDERYFGTDNEFLAISTDSEDTLSNMLYYVKTMQELVKFHTNDTYSAAKVRMTLKRLMFAYDKTTNALKANWYEKALLREQQKLAGKPTVAEVNARLVSLYIQLNDGSTPQDQYYLHLKKAHQLCEQTIQKYSESRGGRECSMLKFDIEKKLVGGQIEEYTSANKPVLIQLRFKNVKQVQVLVYALKDDLNNYYNDLSEYVEGLKLVQSHKIDLPQTDDFNEHSTELALDPLSYGKYLLVYSSDSTHLNSKNGVYWAAPFQVTDLVYSTRDLSSTQTGVEVVDRYTGKPISKATVNVHKSEYNYTLRKYVTKKIGSYLTDVNGWAIFLKDNSSKNYGSNTIEIQKGNDKLSSNIYLPYYNEVSKTVTYDHLFTDRSIYRPGQTVYFKGIRLAQKDKTSKIVPNQTVLIAFSDANSQNVAELSLVSNEYGSYSGSFTIPTTGLTGVMTLTGTNASVSFSVEEYKRPTFKVKFVTSKEEFKLGDNIKVEGEAMAYAGNAIDGAAVTYVVKRRLYLPYWYGYRYRIAPFSQAETIIRQGETKTDEKGHFTISFEALKDDTKDYPGLNYNYTIEAVVTDPNGETRTATKYISLSDNSLHLNVTATNWDKSKENSITVSGTNSEGENIPIKGEIRISPLKPKSQGITVGRGWEAPDKPLLSMSEFQKLFPHLEYKPTSEIDREKKVNVKFLNFNTATSKEVKIDVSNWEAGDYIIETTTLDKNGKQVRNDQFVKLIDTRSKKAQPGEILFVQTPKTTYEPGETIDVAVSSALENQLVLMEVNVDGTIVEHKHLILNNEQKTISFKVEEKHRGGLSFHFTTIKYGKPLIEEVAINVPYSNKELQVSFETFRDKLKPGETEEWRLRISGPKKEKVAAEMLITMYDASLDAFRNHAYYFQPFRNNNAPTSRSFRGFGWSSGRYYNRYYGGRINVSPIVVPQLNTFGFYSNYSFGDNYYIGGIQVRSSSTMHKKSKISREDVENLPVSSPSSMVKTQAGVVSDDLEDGSGSFKKEEYLEEETTTDENVVVPLRSNFNETAFFFPQLKTDENGDILVHFTVPESMTSWKVMGLTHTKELEYALFQKEVVTQKELMVQTNLPRFIRTGDEVFLTAKISNLTESYIGGTAKIQLFDALTMKDVSREFNVTAIYPDFNIDGKQSAVVTWRIKAPEGINSLVIRVSAKGGNHTDGEELTVPVLTDKVLVTESMPLTNNGIGAKDFVFDKLVNSGSSSTLTHHAVTLEYTSNPAWYVVQALPYMMEYPHDCSEQIFTRFYANSIASNIVRSSPKIKDVMDQWKNSSPDAFLSNLEKNQSLKSVVLEETPWVLDAKDESERKKCVALLFDFNKLDGELAKNMKQLQDAQVSNGGFPWFPGMPESRYITQYIVSGMGHLNELGIVAVKENKEAQRMIQKAVKYLDARILDDYKEWKRRQKTHPNYVFLPTDIQYLYARSFFNDIKLSKDEQEAVDFYRSNAEKRWTEFSLRTQTMLALSSYRNGNTTLAQTIMKSVLERSITTDEMGMYWKENAGGYYWYQAPIETQALIIEALHVIKSDQKVINNAKIWLLRNKQTTDWKTTTATADACYALLLDGGTFTTQSENIKIEINGKEIKPEDFGTQVEAGTGYFQATWTGKEISADLGKVKVTRQTDGFSWGAMYWQYFESMEKVTSATTNLQLKKQLFVVRQTNSGEIIVPINDGDKLKRGDKVRVRIELKTDRDMEFVHIKDYRAAGFEPVNVLSQYKWQDGLGYYESTKDVATHFFFDFLRKGNYVFEYDIRVSHSGNFSNGFATIECMYAPEFKSHSNGVRVKVE